MAVEDLAGMRCLRNELLGTALRGFIGLNERQVHGFDFSWKYHTVNSLRTPAYDLHRFSRHFIEI